MAFIRRNQACLYSEYKSLRRRRIIPDIVGDLCRSCGGVEQSSEVYATVNKPSTKLGARRRVFTT